MPFGPTVVLIVCIKFIKAKMPLKREIKVAPQHITLAPPYKLHLIYL